MVCIICIAAAAAVGAAVLGPDALQDLLQKLKGALPDAKQTAQSDSVVKWEGTYSFRRKASDVVPVPVAVFVYKGQKRLRIQLRTHALRGDESERVQDELARAMGVTIIARNVPEDAATHEDLAPRREEGWLPEPAPLPRELPR
jgi:hypothetical protein